MQHAVAVGIVVGQYGSHPGVVKRCQAGGGHLPGDHRHTVAPQLVGRWRWPFADVIEETTGAFLRQAGGLAVFAFHDMAATRVGRLAGNARRVQRPRVVDRRVAAPMANGGRAVRHGDVEVVAVHRPAVLELGVVVHEAVHPHPRRRIGGARRHGLLNLGDGTEVHVDVDELVDPGAGRMRVRIDETRRHRHALGVDHGSARTHQVADIIGATDGAEASVLHGKGFGGRLGVLDRVHPGVQHDQVGLGASGGVADAGEVLRPGGPRPPPTEAPPPCPGRQPTPTPAASAAEIPMNSVRVNFAMVFSLSALAGRSLL